MKTLVDSNFRTEIINITKNKHFLSLRKSLKIGSTKSVFTFLIRKAVPIEKNNPSNFGRFV